MEQLTVELEQVPDLVGRQFQSDPFSISRKERDTFEAVTGVTEAYPEPDLPEFPSGIVEGFHVLGLIDPLSTKLLRINPEKSYGYNYGLDRVRFIEPILIGQQLVFSFEVAEVKEKNGGFLMSRVCRVEQLDGAERPAMIADWLTLLLPGESK